MFNYGILSNPSGRSIDHRVISMNGVGDLQA